jgi:NNP family nitrate/nitrite transporter-like MFS transporter
MNYHKHKQGKKENTFLLAAKDYRTWILTVAYAACFGVEITIDNFAASYFHDDYKATLIFAGLLASIFGWINIFARPMGGIISDKVGRAVWLQRKSKSPGNFIIIGRNWNHALR